MTISIDLTSFGMSRIKRSEKARKQPRDHLGRWVGSGAFVKWHSNGNDHESPGIMTGVVKSIKDGKAQVQVLDENGNLTDHVRTLEPSSLGVVQSKARLPIQDTEVSDDPDNDSSAWANTNKAALKGGQRMRSNREDGYSVEAGTGKMPGSAPGTVENPHKEKKKSSGNPIIYQLYAGSGRSLGIFDESATDDLNDIIDSDKEAIDSGEVIEAPGTPTPGDGGGTGGEGGGESAAPGPVAASGVFSIPKAVDEELSCVPEFDDFRGKERVSLSDVVWAKERVNEQDHPNSYRWANKVVGGKPLRHVFDPTTYSYYAYSDSDASEYHGLIALELETGDVYLWDVDNFYGPVATIKTFTAEHITEIDSDSAEQFAEMLLDRKEFTLREADPAEANMFELAEPFMDSELLGFAMTRHNAQQRSADATSEARDSNGKFAKPNATERNEAVYFAVVDEDDESLVLDAIAVADFNGKKTVYKRSDSQWVPDVALETQLTSIAPPTLVQLEDEDVIKEVLGQIDDHDNGEKFDFLAPENQEYSTSGEDPVAASGVPVPEGTRRIENVIDLDLAVREFTSLDLDVVQYIVGRADSLNAREFLSPDILAYSTVADDYGLFGPNGEVIVASADRERSPLTAFRHYWLSGPRAQKIGWGTEGAVDRAAVHFNKYTTPERAVGVAYTLNNLAL